jgi:hypothetical protein
MEIENGVGLATPAATGSEARKSVQAEELDGQSSTRASNKKQRRSCREVTRKLAVYSSRDCIGYVICRAGGFVALRIDHRSIGNFRSMTEASNALSRISMRVSDDEDAHGLER